MIARMGDATARTALLVIFLLLPACTTDSAPESLVEEQSKKVCRAFGVLAAQGLSAELDENEMLERMRTITNDAQEASAEVQSAAEALLAALEEKEGYPGDRVLKRMAAACRPFRSDS